MTAEIKVIEGSRHMADDTDGPELLTDEEATAYLRLGGGTLANWRLRGRGPSLFKAGTRVLYAKSDLDAWLAARRNERREAVAV